MARIFVNDEQAADDWIYEHSEAGYPSHHIVLTDEDIALLKAGKYLAVSGEYGIVVSWWDGKWVEGTGDDWHECSECRGKLWDAYAASRSEENSGEDTT